MTAEDFAGKLALGTAQFGMTYGINNKDGQPSDEILDLILAQATQAGISLLDTAAAYGNSEARLGDWLSCHQQPFGLVTKVEAKASAAVHQAVKASLARLRQPRVHAVLFHDFGALQRQPDAWEGLLAARAEGLAQRIGVSLYHPWQAEWLQDHKLDVDVVQVPYNVLDQRFNSIMPHLAARGIDVHVRSAFLQGLLLRQLDTLPVFFEPLRFKLQQLRAVAASAAIPLEAALLLFAATAPGVDKVVIGVDSVDNLRSNLAAGAYSHDFKHIREQLATLAEPEETYVLPYNWPPSR